MKFLFCHKSLAIYVTLLLSLGATAQEKTVVKASVDRNAILIGEQLVLRLEADIPQDQPIRFFQLDTLAHFEILNPEKIDTVNTRTGTKLSQAIHLTSFDSGHWVIPALMLGDSLRTDSLIVDVSFSPFDTSQAYHDVKDIIDVKAKVEEKEDYTLWYALAGVLVVGIVVFLLLRKKKKPVVVAPPEPIDPYKQAMVELRNLEGKKMEPKVFYTEMVSIFRVYVKERKGIQSQQQTTDDLVKQLRQLQLGKSDFDRLAEALRMSDFVKFAKYEPAKEDDDFVFNNIKKSIQLIEEMRA